MTIKEWTYGAILAGIVVLALYALKEYGRTEPVSYHASGTAEALPSCDAALGTSLLWEAPVLDRLKDKGETDADGRLSQRISKFAVTERAAPEFRRRLCAVAIKVATPDGSESADYEVRYDVGWLDADAQRWTATITEVVPSGLPLCANENLLGSLRNSLAVSHVGNINRRRDIDAVANLIVIEAVAQTAFDETAQRRRCTAEASLTLVNGETIYTRRPISYRISWTDRAAGQTIMEIEL